jgi:hypothetical protein
MAERNLVLFGILKTKKEVYKLNKERISIGRNRNSQIVINNNTISKDHAIIEFDEDGNAIIKDLNSSNGTYVNGQRLKVIPIRLKTGDKITFGKYDMEFIFEAFNTNGDSKTEADMNQYMFNGNNINNMNMNNNNFNSASKDSNRVIFDKKINLVNENEISFARMNHFQNNNTQKNFDKNNNKNYNEYNSNDLYTDNNNNIYIENENNNNNNEQILQKKIDELEKRNSEIETEKEELTKKNSELTDDLNKKITELKKMTNLFDELNEEYSKLNAKHNALMVYASDIQKKLDLSNIELSQLKNKCHANEETDKIINEKENVIAILQNEINYYKKLCGKNNNFNYNTIPQNDVGQKLDSLIDKYINENKKLKQQNDAYKKKLKNIQKKEFMNKNIDFGQFEIQINYQIDNFNSIIKDYNDRLNESLNKISELFEDAKKEEAAKYLIEQINNYMQENQRLISENAKLNTQLAEYQAQLNSFSKINLNKFMNNNNINNILEENSDDNDNGDEIDELRNKVDELENVISKINNNNINDNNNLNNFSNNNGNVRDAFVNALSELKKKDQIILDLQNKIKENINNIDNNYDFTNSKINNN